MLSFGIFARPLSLTWEDVRKGPPAEAVREHLHRIVNFGHPEETAATLEDQ